MLWSRKKLLVDTIFIFQHTSPKLANAWIMTFSISWQQECPPYHGLGVLGTVLRIADNVYAYIPTSRACVCMVSYAARISEWQTPPITNTITRAGSRGAISTIPQKTQQRERDRGRQDTRSALQSPLLNTLTWWQCWWWPRGGREGSEIIK